MKSVAALSSRAQRTACRKFPLHGGPRVASFLCPRAAYSKLQLPVVFVWVWLKVLGFLLARAHLGAQWASSFLQRHRGVGSAAPRSGSTGACLFFEVYKTDSEAVRLAS